MRQKRAKAYKRVMALYVAAFGFRQPYQILTSNEFWVEAAKQREVDVMKMLGTTVQGESKPMITQCCMEALYQLGKEHQHVVNLAKKCERRKCNHRTAIDWQECIKDVVGETNKHRYVLAIASPKFMTTMSRVPGLPIIHYNPRGVLVLSPPSQATIRVKNASEEDRRIEGAKVLDGVVDGDNVVGADSAGAAAAARGQEGPRARKKVKGANPLSMKKKKPKTDEAQVGKKRRHDDGEGEGEEDNDGEGEGEGEGQGDDAGRRKKKRRRGRGKGAVASAIADLKEEIAAKAATRESGEGEGEGDGDQSD